MSRLKRVTGLGALGLTIAALGAGAIVGRRYVEQRLLADVLGEGCSARNINVHWMRSTGCVEAFETSLPTSRDQHDNPFSLYADKLWFVFDNAQLLRKRLVLPRVVAEGVVIAAGVSAMSDPAELNVDFDLDFTVDVPGDGSSDALDKAETPELTASDQSSQRASSTQSSVHPGLADGSSASREWIARMAVIRDELTSDRFAKSRQVAVDTEMLSERMQMHFENVRQQAVRALNEARDIQLQIQSLDNVLRHELKIMAQRERIEQLKSSLIGLKSEVTRGDKTLSDELSRVRAALLIEKESLLASSKEFCAPVARDLAIETIEQLIIQALREPTRQAMLLRDMMSKPFSAARRLRGKDVRYAAGQLPATNIESAKLSGELEWDGKRLPFTASGSFKIPSLDSASVSSIRLVPDSARWQMQIGNNPAATQLLGRSQTTVDSSGLITSTFLHVDDPSNWQTIDLEMNPDRSGALERIQGYGTTQFRQWIVKQAESSSHELRRVTGGDDTDSFATQWIRYALSDVEAAPESMRFRFIASRGCAADRQVDLAMNLADNQSLTTSPSLDDAELILAESASDWLGERIAKAATTEIADLTLAAAHTLESHITQRIVEMQRSVAVMRSDADQFLNQQMDELRKIQTAINTSLQQRAGTHFARMRSEEVVR